MAKNELDTILNENVRIMNFEMESFPWEDKRAYADLMAQTYWYSRHTTRILGQAGNSFGFDENNHHYRFLKHASEEKGHENLATNDIKALGFNLEDFDEKFSTMALYQTQYYWIDKIGPSSIYGYILALEAFAVESCRKMYEICSNHHGEKTASFWKVHADDDPGHVENALEFVKKLDPSVMNHIAINLRQTAHNYSSIYSEIKSEFDQNSQAA